MLDRGRGITAAQLASFCREFSTMLSAGVKLMPAIVALRQQAEGRLMRELLLEVQEELENGQTLAAAFSRHPDVFSPFFIQLIRQGEIEGMLPDVLQKLADHYGSDGQTAAERGGGQVVVNVDVATIFEALRPLLLMVFIAVAVVGVVVGAIWYAIDAGWITDRQSGPTILVSGALTLLLVAVALNSLRRRRRQAPGLPATPVAAAAPPPTAHGLSVEPAALRETDAAYLHRDPSQPVDLDET